MKRILLLGVAVAAGILAGCETTLPPGVERGPHGTIAYDVLIEASSPGARIDVNGQSVGNTPVHIKVFGDKDGTFHDFGSYTYEIRAVPLTTNQFAQVRSFGTGRAFTPQDRIPEKVYFDMQQPMPYPPNGAPPAYPYPGYGPYYYGPPVYYGPSVRFYYGPGHYHYRPYHHW